jgi:hypothetical protein
MTKQPKNLTKGLTKGLTTPRVNKDDDQPKESRSIRNSSNHIFKIHKDRPIKHIK